MREFNTSGPNNPKDHYTVIRTDAIEAGKQLVYKKKYFTVWAPRQTGKSTWFRQLAIELEKELMDAYKEHIKRRGFRPYREKDAEGNYKSIPEAVMVYSFETYIQAFLQMAGATSYREAQASLGNTDLIINIANKEYLIETKIYRYPKQFEDGKKQLAYYAKSLALSAATYLVFMPNNIRYPKRVKEITEVFDGIAIQTFIVPYDEVKDFDNEL